MTNQEMNYTPYPGVDAEDMTEHNLTQAVKDLEQQTQASAPVTVQASGPVTETQEEQEEKEPIKASQIETMQEPEPEPVERFDVDTESKLMKAFLKVFSESETVISEEKLLEIDTPGVTDLAHVCMCVAKTTRAKLILRRFFTGQCKVPSDVSMNLKNPGNSMYSLDYFQNILKILYVVTDHFRIIEGTDSPCIIESEDFKFLLAPRIEED